MIGHVWFEYKMMSQNWALKENKIAVDVSADPVFFCRGSTQLSSLTRGADNTQLKCWSKLPVTLSASFKHRLWQQHTNQ